MKYKKVFETKFGSAGDKSEGQIKIICLFSEKAPYVDKIKKTLEDEFRVWALTEEMTESTVGDLYLVDAGLYSKNERYLKELKEAYSPKLLPVLVFVTNNENQGIDEDIYEVADDVIVLPQQFHVLKKRIKLLIRFGEMTRQMVQSQIELKAEKEKLVKEKEHHALLTNNSTDIIILHNLDGTYDYISPSVEKVLGYKPEELVGKDPYETTHPEDMESTRKKHEFLLKTGKTVKYTHRKRHKNGKYVWVEALLKPVRNPETRALTGLVSNSRDVSQRVNLENKLKEEKDFVFYAADNMPGTFYMLDENLNFRYWNKTFVKQLGYCDEEIKEISPYDLFDDKGKIVLKKKVEEVFAKGKTEFTQDIFTKTGEKRTYFIVASLITKGEEKLIVGSGVDITDRTKAQYESNQQKQLMDAIINQAESIIFVKDREGKLKLVNQTYLDLFGLTYEEAINQNERVFLDQEVITELMENDRKVFSEKKPMTFEEKVEINGETKFFQTLKYFLKDVPGFEDCICGISTDITNKKNLQYALEERIKENTCLFNISRLLEGGKNVCDVMTEVVKIIPEGFQFPDKSEVKITYGDCEVQTDDFGISHAMLESKVSFVDSKPLQIQVALFKDKSEMDFLVEELDMINAICDTVGSRLGRIINNEKLRESEQRWENLVQNDPDLIMIIQDGIVKFLNEAGANMYNSTPEKMIGKKLFNLIEVKDYDVAIQRMNNVLNGEAVEPYIHKVKNPETGEQRFLQIQSIPTLYQGTIAIQMVGTDLTERVKFENELKKSIQEKEILLQEIHHRVKNNLAIISGLLEIQFLESDDPRLTDILSESVSRIRSIALVHEKLYSQNSLSKVNLACFLADLTSTTKDMYGINERVQIKLNTEPVFLNVNQAVPCALLLNEIITNALKHAFTGKKDGGVIEVNVEQNQNRVSISVQDNGKGFQGDLLKDNQTMGVTIIKTLVDQLDAIINAESDGGTRINFEFELKNGRGSSGNIIE